MGQLKSTYLEKEILEKIKHPFLVGLDYVFQTDERIYFIMEFVRGGELYANMKKMPNKRFEERDVRFYISQIAVALGYLHEQKIIYRDLKPENVLI